MTKPKPDARTRAIGVAIRRSIRNSYKNQKSRNVAVFLSGGADSTTVALAAHHLGYKPVAFSYEIAGFPNADCRQAAATCRAMGWKFHKVVLTDKHFRGIFPKLFTHYGCRLKTEAEILFVCLELLKAAKQQRFDRVLTGFGAPYPDTRESAIRFRNGSYWQDEHELVGKGETPATSKVLEVAHREFGITILMPLQQHKILDALDGLSYRQLLGNDPFPKSQLKLNFYDDFASLELLKDKQTPLGENLQGGGKVEAFFVRNVLKDKGLRKLFEGYKGTDKLKLKSLCQYLGRNSSAITSDKKLPAEYRAYAKKDVNRASAKELFSVVSTFAGGGGSSTGYRLAGGDIKFVNEFVDEAVKSYRANYPNTPIDSSDIRSITKSAAKVQALCAKYGVKKGQLDILDGSPPCKDFSQAKGAVSVQSLTNELVSYSDTKQRRIGMLIHDFVFFAKALQPKVCVIENVPGIQRSKVFHDAITRLRDDEVKPYGYLVSWKVLVASDYGVPQNRKRLFAIAVRKDIGARLGMTDDEDVASIFPVPTTAPITLKSALKGLKIDDEEREQLLADTLINSNYQIVLKLKKNPDKPLKPSDLKPPLKSHFNLVRNCWHRPAVTITQTGEMKGRSGPIHPDEDRKFTIAELKRIMSLPDDFVLTGTNNQQRERVGRMVPPLLTKAVADAIYEKVLKPLDRKS